MCAHQGLHPVDVSCCAAKFISELSGRAVRYLIDDTITADPATAHRLSRRLILVPLSWTEIALDELQPATMSNPLHYSEPPLDIFIVPLSVVCAAYARLASREHQSSDLRRKLLCDLTCLVVEALFDTSYQGDYQEIIPDSVPFTEEELIEMDNAATEIASWNSRPGEEWIKQHLINLVTAKGTNADFPSSWQQRAPLVPSS